MSLTFFSDTLFYSILSCRLEGLGGSQQLVQDMSNVWTTHVTPAAIQMRVSEGVSGLSLRELQPTIKKEWNGKAEPQNGQQGLVWRCWMKFHFQFFVFLSNICCS